jgi:predicted ArsR family transcriptional regulator
MVVARFLTAYLRDLDDLQLLITMVNAEDRWWDAPNVARELHISESAARAALEHLAADNLLEIRLTGDVRYQFHPGTEDLREQALACADAYRTDPLAVVRAVSASARTSVRDFADAFRIRRDGR